ncbi:glycosyltransferase family 4 protein [Aneurinibacillus sp. Ricciae_BoGa-3]|uniref:glycosyltransferase family 4 protein n=1 Tax=Aneurinibacillus sp. Ricciae_BoGa-3 TaxID=3022697 RepID=UPI00234199BB|nr:glycosyltransferase family 4 protein [Aneurinibacillus sp. Ricciae_BoGa-3]WCK53725.1 glycosyltransferase family 4 protein [Aneurinibacillus sp. Ricciae_BoGa-3]
MKPNKSIAEIGVYPPPVGGISVHIERLCDRLEQEGCPFIIYDGSGQSAIKDRPVVPLPSIEKWSWRYLFQRNEDIIHNHFLRWQMRFTLSLLKLKGKKIVHTIHSLRNDSGQLSAVHKMMVYMTGVLSDHFVAVSPEIKDKLVELKIPARKISVIPAFIPPDTSGSNAALAKETIPAFIWDFFAKHPRVIAANGGVGNLYNGSELYGLDLCVDAFIELAHEFPDVGYVYCITHVVDDSMVHAAKEKLQNAGLSDRFLFVQEKIPFYPLIQEAALFVRPTRSDGDAISIREALYFGTPAIASNVVQRPNGTVVFADGDAHDFAAKCRDALVSPPNGLAAYKEEQEQYVEQLKDILF